LASRDLPGGARGGLLFKAESELKGNLRWDVPRDQMQFAYEKGNRDDQWGDFDALKNFTLVSEK
jgi:hypothetical protein